MQGGGSFFGVSPAAEAGKAALGYSNCETALIAIAKAHARGLGVEWHRLWNTFSRRAKKAAPEPIAENPISLRWDGFR